jgi:hypothetical protein
VPKVNFSNVPDAGAYPVAPEGIYRLEIVEIDDTAETKAGEEMWRLRLKIVSGEYKGCFVFDNLTFNTKALGKAKMLCKAVGVDVSKEFFLTPAMLIHKELSASVIVDDYQGQTRNKIPFAGYSVPQEGTSVPEKGTDVPFPEPPKKDEAEDEQLPF